MIEQQHDLEPQIGDLIYDYSVLSLGVVVNTDYIVEPFSAWAEHDSYINIKRFRYRVYQLNTDNYFLYTRDMVNDGKWNLSIRIAEERYGYNASKKR